MKYKFKIYQIDEKLLNKDESSNLLFMPWRCVGEDKFNINFYFCRYEDEIEVSDVSLALDMIFSIFNFHIPEDFQGHSLSISDIVVFDDLKKVYYCDTFGWEDITNIWHKQIAATLSGELDLVMDNSCSCDAEVEDYYETHQIKRDTIQGRYGKLVVDTSCIGPSEYETMVFRCKSNLEPDWGNELDCYKYDNEVDAMKGHNSAIAKWAI